MTVTMVLGAMPIQYPGSEGVATPPLWRGGC